MEASVLVRLIFRIVVLNLTDDDTARGLFVSDQILSAQQGRKCSILPEE